MVELINGSMAEKALRVHDWRAQEDHQAQPTGLHLLVTHLTAKPCLLLVQNDVRAKDFWHMPLVYSLQGGGNNYPASDD